MKTLPLLLALLVSVGHAQNEHETLFREKCSSCHALPDPQSLNEKQWQAVLRTMQKRMSEAGKTPLNDLEFKKIFCFVSQKPAAECQGSR